MAGDLKPRSVASDELAAGRSRLVAVVVTGAYAWGLTVLPSATVHGFSSVVGIFAFLALGGLVLSPFLPPGRLSLIAGLDVFVGCCLISWWAGRGEPLRPPFAVFGSLGWLAYTFAWGSLSTPRELTTSLSPGPHLEPRTPPSRVSTAVMSLLLAGSLFLLAAAWRVERPALLVLSHVIALAAALLLLRSGAHFAIAVQARGTKMYQPLRLRAAWGPLTLLAVVLTVGLVWSLAPG
jgi:hypothetical protein